MDKLLENYKKISNEILQALKDDKLSEAECKLEKRNDIIKEIKAQDDKYKLLDYKLDLLKIDNDIKNEIINMQIAIKKEIEEINQNRAANSIYGKQFKDIFFINKQA